jgi:hypothetical protein
MSEQHDEKKATPRAPRKPPHAAAAEHAPYRPPEYEPKHQGALQALANGTASAHQQRLALDWIVHKACGTYDEPYRPGGEDGSRDTTFALGRAFAGRQIVKLINTKTRGGNDGPQ